MHPMRTYAFGLNSLKHLVTQYRGEDENNKDHHNIQVDYLFSFLCEQQVRLWDYGLDNITVTDL